MKPPAWLAFIALLLGEYLAISYRFDAHQLLAPLVGEGGMSLGGIAPLALVTLVAIVITGGSRVQRAMVTLEPWRGASFCSGSWAIAHLATIFSCFFLAERLTTSPPSPTGDQGWIVVWLTSPVLATVCLVFAVWDRAQLRRAFDQMRAALGLGVGVGFLAWGAGHAAALLWNPLTRLTLELVHAQLTVVTRDPVASVEHTLVGTSRFYVHIAPVCSGVEGIGLTLAFMSAFLYLSRQELKWPRALLLLPLSISGIWLLNSVRLTALVLIGTWGLPDVALGGFHSKAGWVLFTGACLAAIALVRRSHYFYRLRQDEPQTPTPPTNSDDLSEDENKKTFSPPAPPKKSPDAAYLVPLLSVITVTLMTGLLQAEFDHLYPLRLVAAGGCLFLFRHQYPSFSLSFPWLPLAVGVLVAGGWAAGFQNGAASENNLGEQLAQISTPWSNIWLVSRVLGTSITVPIVEELAFRGYLLRRVAQRDFEKANYRASGWTGLLVSSAIFGALHSQWLLGTLAGMIFGALAMYRNRLSDAVWAHAIANATLAAYAIIDGHWELLA